MGDVSGDFEIHLTCHAVSAEPLEALAARHGLKFVHIVLDRGSFTSQPMVTLTGRGPAAEQQAVLDRWQRELHAEKIYPCRAKVEVTPWSEGVPRSDAAALDEPAERYFEHHVKLRLPSSGRPVTELVTAYGARLSRNARRDRPDGAEERFVTQRCHQVGSETARRRLDELLRALLAARHEVLEVEQEYVVHDSNLAHDHGWLTEPRAPGPIRREGAGSPD
jgi:hypothetical protein